jgi:hypothetical protein
MRNTVQLRESVSVTLNASGNGTAKIGPVSGREIWSPTNVHVSATTNVSEATCTIYVGSTVGPNAFRDETFTGSSGDSTDKVNADSVMCGSYVWAVWVGGDIGAQATMNVTGTKDL